MRIETLEQRRLLAALTAAWDTQPDTWVATDGLGRALPSARQAAAPRDRTVGVFYFLWAGQHGSTVYDISKLLADNPTNPAYGPEGRHHHWSEPLFGYYRGDDRSVIRKHLQMLADADVDFIALDMTNNITYGESTRPFDSLRPVIETIADMQAKGLRTPQWIPFASATSATWMWNNIYSTNQYRSTWFEWKGKPLVMMKQLEAPPAAMAQAFTVRQSWAWNNSSWWGTGATAGQDRWPWIQDNATQYGWTGDPSVPEEMAVAIASHPVGNLGRSYRGTTQPTGTGVRSDLGIRFNDQVIPALNLDPQVTFFTGWNEWTAQRFVRSSTQGAVNFLGQPVPVGGTYFVDLYNNEFSRDAEPSRGPLGDNYYYQLVNYVRRIKGVRAVSPITPGSIAIDGTFADWASVGPEFRDDIGDQTSRNNPGYATGVTMLNTTGRADIVAAKVSYTAADVSFYVRTANALPSPALSNDWMLLYVDADRNPSTGWLGYDYVINRSRTGSTTSVQRNVGNAYSWTEVGTVPFRRDTDEVELTIPRTMLNLPSNRVGIDFKWADNVTAAQDWTDFTLNGDAAPNNRFNYRANFTATATAPPTPWRSADIGAVPTFGSAAAEYANSLTVRSRSADYVTAADQARIVYQTVTGDFDLTVRVAQLERASDWTRALLTMRESLDAGSRHVSLAATSFNGLQQIVRSTANAVPTTSGTTANTPFEPVWLQLSRRGNTVTLSQRTSASGPWVQVGQATVAFATAQVGVGTSSTNTGVDSIARFDEVNLKTDFVAPTIVSTTYDPETAQRVKLTFSEDVSASLSAGAFSIVDRATSQPIAGASVGVTWDAVRREATITANPALPRGRYRLTAPGSAITDAAGNPLAAGVSVDFVILPGDATRDGVVNFDDLLTLAANYNTVGRGFSQGNFNYDANSAVDFDDLLLLAANYNTSLAASAGAPLLAPPPPALGAGDDDAGSGNPSGELHDILS